MSSIIIHSNLRYDSFLPLTPSIVGFLLMALAMISILLAKYTLISVVFINVPYVFPMGMVIEYFMITLIFYLLFGNKKCILYDILHLSIHPK